MQSMVTPTVRETQNRRHRPLLDEIAQDNARRVSREAFCTVGSIGGHNPLWDDTFDVEATLREAHDYPSLDTLMMIEGREMA